LLPPAAPPAAPAPVALHEDPPTAGRDRAAKWAAAESFEDFLAGAQSYEELWAAAYARAEIPEAVLARVRALPGRWHLLAVSADWCIDAPSPVGTLAALAARAPNLALRHLDRDRHLDLMDEHLTNGRSRSIPIVILLDEALRERAWWGPRPSVLQAWVTGEGEALERAERYRRSRQWMARDRGQTTLEEVVGMAERAAAKGPGIG
jgi:hypothetical protein